MEWTHAIVTGQGKLVELANPSGMTLTVPSGCSAIAKAQMMTWIGTYTDLDGVCTHFGWDNQTGETLDGGD